MKFKKSDLKRIIAEELTRSSELRRFLSERGEIKPGTIKQNPQGSRYKYSAMADVYGTDPSHYTDPEDMLAYMQGNAPSQEMEVQLDKYGNELVPKLPIEDVDASGMFTAGDLSQRQVNAMFRKNTPVPGDMSAGAQQIRQTKGRAMGAAIGKLLAAQAACQKCDAPGMDQCVSDLEEAIQILTSINYGFNIEMP